MRRRGGADEERRSRTVVELSVQPRAPAPPGTTAPAAHKNSAYSSRYVKPSPFLFLPSDLISHNFVLSPCRRRAVQCKDRQIVVANIFIQICF